MIMQQAKTYPSNNLYKRNLKKNRHASSVGIMMKKWRCKENQLFIIELIEEPPDKIGFVLDGYDD